ncbi:T9SS type A sorting domain-containing protein [Larkinella insperata]|uniref:T9SS type A sorting domain-containing protein n=1 Tax=Larkinella insperata TaxID=332158 RepID=A0ABW3Q829_9BACT|nr:T9SS type A sorting domain-containing protein [Larkinella insperata]
MTHFVLSFSRFRRVSCALTLAAYLTLGLAPRLFAQTITTVAGNGTQGFSGDGGLAINARLRNPQDVAADSQGNLFVADTDNNRIRKIAPNGTISTIAGTGSAGFNGDGKAATSASLNRPSGVAVDAQGNIFITDRLNQRIRKIDASGMISTVAGSGIRGFAGDGGAATSARLADPQNITLDGQGNLFIADSENNRIRKVNTNGIINTVAGNGSADFSGDGGLATDAALYVPQGVAVDAQGNIFIADLLNLRVRKVTTNGIINTVAGNGSTGFNGDNQAATSASLDIPQNVMVDTQNNLFIADILNHRVRKVASNGIINTVVGSGLQGFSGDGGIATSANLYRPASMALDAQGNLFIVDSQNHRIRKVTPQSVGLAVVSFSLINADTDQEIKVLTPGEQLNLATLPTRNLNIRANTSPTTVGSVVMQLSGRQNRTQIETEAPYALFNDIDGDYRNWTPYTGTYSLTVTPYTGPKGTGTAGTPFTLSFSVIDQPSGARLNVKEESKSAEKVLYYPNPFRDSFTVKLQGQENAPIMIYDQQGRLVWQQTEGKPEQRIELDNRLQTGMYLMQVGVGPKAKRYKLIKSR